MNAWKMEGGKEVQLTSTLKESVDFGLDHQLGMLGVDAFQLDGHLVVVRDVRS